MRPFIGPFSALFQLPQLGPQDDTYQAPHEPSWWDTYTPPPTYAGLQEMPGEQLATPIPPSQPYQPPQAPAPTPPAWIPPTYAGLQQLPGDPVAAPTPPKSKNWIDDYYASFPAGWSTLAKKTPPVKVPAPLAPPSLTKKSAQDLSKLHDWFGLTDSPEDQQLLANTQKILNTPIVEPKPLAPPGMGPTGLVHGPSDKAYTGKDVNLPTLVSLPPSEETKFQAWTKRYGIQNPDDPQQFYDYRAAYKAGAKPDASGHWPSQFKLAGHPNEVVGGFNTRTGERVPGTERMSESELVARGWAPADAKRLAATPEPFDDRGMTQDFVKPWQDIVAKYPKEASRVPGIRVNPNLRDPKNPIWAQIAPDGYLEVNPDLAKKSDIATILRHELAHAGGADEKTALAEEQAALYSGKTPSAADFRLPSPAEQEYKKGAEAIRSKFQTTIDQHASTVKTLSGQIEKQRPGIDGENTALQAEGAAFDARSKALVADSQALKARIAAWEASGKPAGAALDALKADEKALDQRFKDTARELEAFNIKQVALKGRIDTFNGLIGQQKSTAAAAQTAFAQATAALKQHTAAFMQSQQAGPRAYVPPPELPGPAVPPDLLRLFQPKPVAPPPAPPSREFAPPTSRFDWLDPADQERIDPTTGKAVQGRPGAGPLDAAKEAWNGAMALVGTSANVLGGIGGAMGEEIFGPMKGHEKESNQILHVPGIGDIPIGRLKAHADTVLAGIMGDRNAQVLPSDIFLNPPETVEQRGPIERTIRAQRGLSTEEYHAPTKKEALVEEVTRRGMNLAARAAVDPAMYGGARLPGAAGQLLAGMFAIDGFKNAVGVAKDPNSTDEDVATAFLMAGVVGTPLLFRASLETTGELGRQVRASILAAKLKFPQQVRGFESSANTSAAGMQAGIHAPLAAMENIDTSVPTSGITFREAVGLTDKFGKPIPFRDAAGMVDAVRFAFSASEFPAVRNEAKPPAVTVPREMQPGATVQLPSGQAGTIKAIETPVRGIPSITVELPDGRLVAHRPDVLTVTAPVPVEQLAPGEVIGRVVEATSMGNAAEAAQLKEGLLQRIAAASRAPEMPASAAEALKGLASQHPDDVGISQLTDAFRLIHEVTPPVQPAGAIMPEPPLPKGRTPVKGSTQWVDNGTLYIQVHGRTFSYTPGAAAPTEVPKPGEPTVPFKGWREPQQAPLTRPTDAWYNRAARAPGEAPPPAVSAPVESAGPPPAGSVRAAPSAAPRRPVAITLKMHDALVARGFTPEAINAMTLAEIGRALRAPRLATPPVAAPAEATPASPPPPAAPPVATPSDTQEKPDVYVHPRTGDQMVRTWDSTIWQGYTNADQVNTRIVHLTSLLKRLEPDTDPVDAKRKVAIEAEQDRLYGVLDTFAAPPVTPPTAPKPKVEPTGWLGDVHPDLRGAVFTEMRRIDDHAQMHLDKEADLRPPSGTVGVGMADKQEFQQGEARRTFLRELNKGATPQDAAEAAKAMARLIAQKANASRPNDIHSHLSGSAVDASIDDAMRAVLNAAKPKEAPKPAEELTDDDILAALEEAATPTPTWKAGSSYAAKPDYVPADVLAATQTEQLDRQTKIAELTAQVKARTADGKDTTAAEAKLQALQEAYDGTWAELEAHMEGVDFPALKQETETAAKKAVAAAKAKAKAEEPKKEEKKPAKEETPAPKAEKQPEAKEHAPFEYSLDEWKAALREEGVSAAQIDEAIAEATAAGLDPTQSGDLQDLGDYIEASADKPPDPDIVAWHAEHYPETEETAPAEAEPAEGPRSYTRIGKAFLAAVTPEVRTNIAHHFTKATTSLDVRLLRTAMEAYQLLTGIDSPEAREAADQLIAATNQFFGDESYNATGYEGARAAGDAAFQEALNNAISVVTEGQGTINDLDEWNAGDYVDPSEVGKLIFNTLDPRTASFDIQEFHRIYGEIEFRREPETVFPPVPEQDTVTLWEGRSKGEKGEPRDPATMLPPIEGADHDQRRAAGAAQIEAWKAEAEAEGAKPNNENYKKVIISLYDRTGIVSEPWKKAGYSVRQFDIRRGEDLTDFGAWMDEIEQILAEGYTIVGVIAQPPCTSFTSSGSQHWPTKHDAPGYIDQKTGLTWLEKTYGKKASEHFDTPLDYANTLVAVVKLVIAQANPRFYAMENPVGRIGTEQSLPDPVLKYNPDDFGEDWTKATQLWGEFDPHLPLMQVGGYKSEGGKGSIIQNTLGSEDKDERAETPVGFAYAFFMGNKHLAEGEWQNQERPPFNMPEGKYIPEDQRGPGEGASIAVPPVIAFRSGNQTSPTDTAAFIKAGQDVGVTALGMTGPVRAQIVAHVAGGGNAFIDSGAFGKTEIVDGKGRSTINFDAVLSKYDKLADDIEGAAKRADEPLSNIAGLYVVAPDVAPVFVDPHDSNRIVPRKEGVSRSFPDETKAVQDQYAPQITAAIERGMQVIVPVQVGPSMAARAVEVLQQFPGAMIGLPGNQGAISDGQFEQMLAAIEKADEEPAGFHFLGIGEKNTRLNHLASMVRDTFPQAQITSDASRANAMFVEGRPAQAQLKARIQALAEEQVDKEWASDTTELAGDFYRGDLDGFTDAELTQLAQSLSAPEAGGLTVSLAQLKKRTGNGTAIESLVERSGLEDALMLALYQIANARGLKRKANTKQARGEVITERDRKKTPGQETGYRVGDRVAYNDVTKPVAEGSLVSGDYAVDTGFIRAIDGDTFTIETHDFDHETRRSTSRTVKVSRSDLLTEPRLSAEEMARMQALTARDTAARPQAKNPKDKKTIPSFKGLTPAEWDEVEGLHARYSQWASLNHIPEDYPYLADRLDLAPLTSHYSRTTPQFRDAAGNIYEHPKGGELTLVEAGKTAPPKSKPAVSQPAADRLAALDAERASLSKRFHDLSEAESRRLDEILDEMRDIRREVDGREPLSSRTREQTINENLSRLFAGVDWGNAKKNGLTNAEILNLLKDARAVRQYSGSAAAVHGQDGLREYNYSVLGIGRGISIEKQAGLDEPVVLKFGADLVKRVRDIFSIPEPAKQAEPESQPATSRPNVKAAAEGEPSVNNFAPKSDRLTKDPEVAKQWKGIKQNIGRAETAIRRLSQALTDRKPVDQSDATAVQKATTIYDDFAAFFERYDMPQVDQWSRWQRAQDDAKYQFARLHGTGQFAEPGRPVASKPAPPAAEFAEGDVASFQGAQATILKIEGESAEVKVEGEPAFTVKVNQLVPWEAPRAPEGAKDLSDIKANGVAKVYASDGTFVAHLRLQMQGNIPSFIATIRQGARTVADGMLDDYDSAKRYLDRMWTYLHTLEARQPINTLDPTAFPTLAKYLEALGFKVTKYKGSGPEKANAGSLRARTRDPRTQDMRVFYVNEARGTLTPHNKTHGKSAAMRLISAALQKWVDRSETPQGGINVQAPEQAGKEGTPEAPTQAQEVTTIEPAKPAPGGRETRADGRLLPRVGDDVYQVVRGFGGTPAHVKGLVIAGKKGELRVQIKGGASLLGSVSGVGKTQKLDESWTVVGDPEIQRRKDARDKAEADRIRQRDEEQVAYQQQVTAAALAAINEQGHEALTRLTPVGARVYGYWGRSAADDKTGPQEFVIDEQTENGPTLREADDPKAPAFTIGNADEDGSWPGYSVVPTKPAPQTFHGYHGSAEIARRGLFEGLQLDIAPTGAPRTVGDLVDSMGTWWTSSRTDAEHYGRYIDEDGTTKRPGAVVEGDITLASPRVFESADEFFAYIDTFRPRTEAGKGPASGRRMRAAMEKAGYDGFVVKGGGAGDATPESGDFYLSFGNKGVATGKAHFPASRPAVSKPAAVQATQSFKVEVTDGSGFASNGIRYPTRAEAEAAGNDLMSRWMAAKEMRVVESEDAPTHNWSSTEYRNVAIAAAPPPSPAPKLTPSGYTWAVGDRVQSYEGTGEISQIRQEGDGLPTARLMLDATRTFGKWTNLDGLKPAPVPAEDPAAPLARYRPGDRVIVTDKGVGRVQDPPLTGKGDRLRVELDTRSIMSAQMTGDQAYAMPGEVRPLAEAPVAPPASRPTAPIDLSSVPLYTPEGVLAYLKAGHIKRLDDAQITAIENGIEAYLVRQGSGGIVRLSDLPEVGFAKFLEGLQLIDEPSFDDIVETALADIMPPVQRPARKPAAAPAPAPAAPSPELTAIEQERARIKAEMDARIKRIKGKLGNISMGLAAPLDPEIVKEVLGLARDYVKLGILEFRDAALQFREHFGDDAKAERYFELAWPLAQELAKGTPMKEALGVVRAQTSRPTVAGAVAAYTQGGAHGGRTAGPVGGVEGRRPAGAGEPGAPAGGPRTAGAGELEGEQPERPAGASAGPRTGGERGPTAGVERPDGGAASPESGPQTTRGGGVHAAGDVDAPAVSNDVDVAAARAQAALHFVITDNADLTESSWIPKLENNLVALRLLKELQRQGRMATSDEQKTLAKYIGWGHTNLAPIVDLRPSAAHERKDPRQRQARTELEGLLTSEELRELGESVGNAHYSFLQLPRAMWSLADRLGFKGGAIIEPAVGTGHFFGTMPGSVLAHASTFLFGVDKEPIAAAIARQLYQGARILTGPLQEQVIPDNYFDLDISNVPFGKVPIFDPAFVSPERSVMSRSIHNYYFGKAQDALRPGGLNLFITSRFTLDARTDVVRQYLARRAKFLGAFRLPDSAFNTTAGTQVVTDVIVLQKREVGERGPITLEDGTVVYPAGEQAWLKSVQRDDLPQVMDAEGNWDAPYVNEYYQAHPEMVLGEQNATGKMNKASNQYNVQSPGKKPSERDAYWQEHNADLLEGVVARFPQDVFKPATEARPKLATTAPADAKQGSYIIEDGKLYVYDKGKLLPTDDLKGGQRERMLAYLPIRDAYQKVLDVMSAHGSDAELTKAQRAMRKHYDAFVAKFGHVSKPYNMRVIDLDPNGSRVLALENTVAEKDAGGKLHYRVTGLADIFTKRTYNPPTEPTTAASAQDALVQSLAWKGQVDVPYMAALTGTPEAVVINDLKHELFYDPSQRAWVTKDEYLSGDVVTKLADAEAAVRTNPDLEGNVAALQVVQPTPLAPEEFEAPFGAPWVPTPVYEQFLRALGGDPNLTVRMSNTEARTKFYVDGSGAHEFLPQGYAFADWASDALNGRLPVITTTVREDGKDKEVRDEKATTEVRESLNQLREAWVTWWRSNLAVSDQLTALYNAIGNREKDRVFDGAHIVLPNKSPDIELRWWQKNVIWRAIQSGNTLLAHAVGAGKTYALTGIAGEMKRLNLAQKPMLVVPNHLVRQWRDDFMRMYPTARVLVPTKSDFQKSRRRQLMARIANNNWDAVIIAQSHFVRVSVSVPTLRAFVREQEDQIILDGAEQMNMSVEDFTTAIAEYAAATKKSRTTLGARGVPRSVKDIVRQVLTLRARLQKRLDQQKRDSPVVFEQLGVDALLIDEAHLFKNLYFSTSKNEIAGLKGSDSQRAMDMFLKVRLINEASNSRNVHFATGTPVSNTLSEAYTVFRYLAQPTMARLGMSGFDAWANSYAVAVPAMEPTADGSYKERTRLREWVNLRELSKLFRRFADVLTPELMRREMEKAGIAFPKLKNDRPTTIAVKAHPSMPAFMSDITSRVAAIQSGKVDPKDDNHLKISTDATLAAIDMRLIDPSAGDYPGSRIQTAAHEIARIYKESKANKGTQLVFLDVGVPKGRALQSLNAILGGAASAAEEADDSEEEDDETAKAEVRDLEQETAEEIAAMTARALDVPLYEDLKRVLVEKYKIPAHEIAFVQQARNDFEQSQLYQAVNDGRVRVMFASTSKGATGMNVQKRLVGLHHLDAPWRPADIEQREGRILRQGNMNAVVEVLRYVTAGSFDEYRWGLLSAKQQIIYKFLRGELTTMDDADPAQLDMEVAQAFASNDPNVLKMLNLQRETKALRARYTNYERRRQATLRDKAYAEGAKKRHETDLAEIEPLIPQAEEWEQAPTITLLMEKGGYNGSDLKPRETPVVYDWKDTDARKQFQHDLVALLTEGTYVPSTGTLLATAGPFQMRVFPVETFIPDQHGNITSDRKLRTYAISVETTPNKSVTRGDTTTKVPRLIGTTPNHDFTTPPDYRRSLDAYLKSSKLRDMVANIRHYIANNQETIDKADRTLSAEFKQKAELDMKETELAEVRGLVGQRRAHGATGGGDLTTPPDGFVGIPPGITLEWVLGPAGTNAFGDLVYNGSDGETWFETRPDMDDPSTWRYWRGHDYERRPNAPDTTQAMAGVATAEPGKFGASPVARTASGRRQGMPSSLPAAAGLKKRAGVNWLQIPNAIRGLLKPEGMGPVARGAGGTIRHEEALSYRALAIAREAMRAFSKYVDGLSREEQVQYWDKAERGESTGDPNVDAGNDVLRELTTRFSEQLVALDRLKAEALRENYIGRFWSLDPGVAGTFLNRILGRRPLRGPESFRKARTWDYFIEGLNAIEAAKERIANQAARPGDTRIAAIRPATYNWVESQLAKIAEMQRAIAAARELKREEAAGRAKKVHDSLGHKPPTDENGEAWVRGPDDPALTVYGPKSITIKEAYDAELMDRLNDWAKALGITHVRKVAIGKGAWGLAGGDNVWTKFGGPETVLMHEIGHVLDARYNINEWLTDPAINKELSALAEERENPDDSATQRKYYQKDAERIANLVHAFMVLPEHTKQVAPKAYAKLLALAQAHAVLQPMLDIQTKGRSLRLEQNLAQVEVAGFPVIGHWYFPKPAAAIWTNHLSTGLRGNPLYDAYMAPAQAATQILLGFSGFHPTTISREAMNSRLAQSVDALANRGANMDLSAATMHAIASVGAPAADAVFGHRIMQEYRRPGTHPELATVLDAMLKGGYRGTAESEFWTGERVENLKQAFKEALEAETKGRRLWGAAKLPLDALWAGIEASMKPIMGMYVPWMKTAATYRAVADALAKQPTDTTTDEMIATMSDIVKEMDYRYGQVVYDNYFMHRMVKDLAQAVLMAPGWTFGSLALASRGVRQLAKVPVRVVKAVTGAGAGKGGQRPFMKDAKGNLVPVPPELIGPAGAYWIGAVLAFMALNGIITYLYTGEFPKGKDYFGYRDGTTDNDGNPNRHILPGYEMRDIYGWTHHPVQTALNKLKPVIGFMARMAQNRTYFGDLIWNPDAPVTTKAAQIGKQAMKDLGTPLSYQNYQEAKRRDTNTWGEVARNAFGITPARREFERTAAENRIAEYQSRGGATARTPERVAESAARGEYRQAVRRGDKAAAAAIEKQGTLTKGQIHAAQQEAKETFLERGFKQLPIDQALEVYEVAESDERAKLWPVLYNKATRLIPQASEDRRPDLQRRWKAVQKLPRARQTGVTIH